MSRLLATQRALTVPGWVKDELWRRARATPRLDLRFADSKSLVDATTGASLVTFTRASSATYVDSQGVIQTASTNIPRFDHNPVTGESLGLLVEEQRTNSIRNNMMVGAVAGTPGTLPTNWVLQAATNGLAVSIVGTGTESGIAYLDWKISGTTTALATADISIERTAALTGQTWASSAYVKLVSGSLAAVTTTFIRIVEEDSSTNFVSGGVGSIPLPTTAALVGQRGSFSRTLTGGGTVAFVRTNLAVTVSSGATVDFTLRIGMPQLEQGAFATSVIPTSGTAATRSADVASITGSAFSSWYRQDEGTVFAEFTPRASGFNGGLMSLDNGTTGERIQARLSTGLAAQLGVSDENASQASLLSSNVANTGALSRGGYVYKANDFAVTLNGTAPVSDTSGTLPTPTQATVGFAVGASYFNGTISRLVYWGQRLPNNVLQALTQ